MMGHHLIQTYLLVCNRYVNIDKAMGETMELSLTNREIYDLAVNGFGKLTSISICIVGTIRTSMPSLLSV
jgi:hypothetical protein